MDSIQKNYIVPEADKKELADSYLTMKARSKDSHLDMALRLKALYIAYGMLEAHFILFGESINGEEE